METISTTGGMHAAHAIVKLYIDGVGELADSMSMLTSFEYTDFLSGEADEIQISFKDPQKLWCQAGNSAKGKRITASIILTEGAISRELHCGDFVIDSPGRKSPDIVTFKALTTGITTNLRRQAKIREWQGVSLKQLASKIAAEQHVRFLFIGEDTPPISKLQQKGESDLKFLLRVCRNEGFALKMGNGKTPGAQMVIQKLSEVDSQSAAITIDFAKDEIIDWEFKENESDAYTACQVRYKHKDKGYLTATYHFTNDSENGQTLVVRQHCGNHAEAIRLAKARLELANRNRITCDMTLPGVRTIADNVWFVSGLTVELHGMGFYNGLYTIDRVIHTVDSSYRTKLSLVKTQ